MEQHEAYSVRQRRLARNGQPVTYVYDPIPDQMRAQAFHALQMAGGPQYNSRGDHHPYWKQLEKSVVREHGYFHKLPAVKEYYRDYSFERVGKYLEPVMHFGSGVAYDSRHGYTTPHPLPNRCS